MGAKARTKISGQPAKNYIDILADDTGAGRSELQELMENREQWK